MNDYNNNNQLTDSQVEIEETPTVNPPTACLSSIKVDKDIPIPPKGSNRNFVVTFEGTINEEIIVSASNEDEATELATDILSKDRVTEYIQEIQVGLSERA